MINVQQQQQPPPQMMQPHPQQMFGQPQRPQFIVGPPPGQGMPPQRSPHQMQMPPGAAPPPPHAMIRPGYGPPAAAIAAQRPPVPVGMQPQVPVVRPPIARPQFHGTEQERKCKNPTQDVRKNRFLKMAYFLNFFLTLCAFHIFLCEKFFFYIKFFF